MKVTLTTSDLITIVGYLVTIVSILWAIYERKQTATARVEAKRFRKLLLEQQISQQFSDVPKCALELFRLVRAKNWDDAAESALLLSSELASLSGVHTDLIGEPNMVQLNTALTVMGEINQRIPRNGVQTRNDIERELMNACNVILLSVNAIERSLRVNAALGGDDDGK